MDRERFYTACAHGCIKMILKKKEKIFISEEEKTCFYFDKELHIVLKFGYVQLGYIFTSIYESDKHEQ